MDSVKQVIPLPIAIDSPYIHDETILQTRKCVLVGFNGEIAGRMLIDGHGDSFGKLGETMFGMALEGEMLHSFVGEMGNMVAGNICTLISQKGRKVDITPPTVIEGEIKLSGFEKAVFIPIALDGTANMNIVFLLHEEKVA
jgi:chemotaxis protein CheX